MLLLASALVAVPAAGAAAPRPSSIRMSVTGEISNLGTATIAVGRLSCSIPAKLAASAGRFVITDPVEITCLNGRLENVKYKPVLPSNQSTRTVPLPPASPGKSPTSAPPSGARSVSYSAGTVSESPPTGIVTDATGTIASFSADGITVEGVTCSIAPLFYSLLSRLANVGDDVTIGCVGGTLADIATVASGAR